ncbi:MAG: GNAT family N-acetyltransferase [Fimbriiglobus sp.]
MTRNDRILVWEAFDIHDPLTQAAERLYLETQHPDERIPWGWIARNLKGRAIRRPNAAGSHLLTAMPQEHADDPQHLAGFAYGSFLPGYGGYMSYLGVDARLRKRGVGSRLFEQMFKVLAADAGSADEPMPFVVWESKKPADTASAEDWQLWEARTRLFTRAGGLWLEGIELYTPNYASNPGEPVKLQLFVKPIDRSLEGFDPEYLREIAKGLLERVYCMHADDPLYQRTMAAIHHPRLRRSPEVKDVKPRGGDLRLVGLQTA